MQSDQTKASQRLAGPQMGEPTSANTAPILILLSITLSVDSLINGEYSFNKSSSLRSDARRESAYGALLAGWDGQLQRDGLQQGIVTLYSHGTFQCQRPLCFSIRNGWTGGWWWRLTGYRELVLSGAQIPFEQSLNVDDVAALSVLRPTTGPHLDLRADLGNRRNISTHV